MRKRSHSLTSSHRSRSSEVHRGEALRIGEHWFRVNAAESFHRSDEAEEDRLELKLAAERQARETGQLDPQAMYSPQPERARPPLSVGSLDIFDDPRVKRYYGFTPELLPLDRQFPTDGLPATSERALRHGFSNDIRQLWVQTRKVVPLDDDGLLRRLREENLSTIASARRPRLRQEQEAQATRNDMARVEQLEKQALKEQKRIERKESGRRSWRAIRLTNTHLQGTALGPLLVGDMIAAGHEIVLPPAAAEPKL